MTKSTETVECTDCGAPIDIGGDTAGRRTPCGKCGSMRRSYNVMVSETVVARDGFGVKAKRAGEKKPYIEEKAVPDYSRSLGKVVHREQIFDRDNDRYFEKVTDYETGEVIHHCDEPLSEHQGHGDARLKKVRDEG